MNTELIVQILALSIASTFISTQLVQRIKDYKISGNSFYSGTRYSANRQYGGTLIYLTNE